MPLTLIGGSVSPFVRKVRVFCAEKGIAYELERLNPFAPPEGFRDIRPLARIPVLRDGDRHVPDSSVICSDVERRHHRATTLSLSEAARLPRPRAQRPSFKACSEEETPIFGNCQSLIND